MTIGINVTLYFLTYLSLGFHKTFLRYTRNCEDKNLHSVLNAAQDRDVNPLMLDGNKGSYVLKHV